MALIRLLAILAVLWLLAQLGIRLYRMLRRPLSQKTVAKSGKVVRCAHCGLHIPENEALWDGESAYCTKAHQLAAAKGD